MVDSDHLVRFLRLGHVLLRASLSVGRSRTTRPSAATSSNAADLVTIWGLPAWVFWGVAVPWMAATTVHDRVRDRLVTARPETGGCRWLNCGCAWRRPRAHFRQRGIAELPDLPDRSLCPGVAFQPAAIGGGLHQRIFPGQSQPGRLGLCPDVRGDERLGRQLRRLSGLDLHSRLGAGVVDRRLHDGAPGGDGLVGQAI